ncbi:MAG: hypothetical protein INH43_03755 [Acidobacteriaceae bacterium]|jgi:hypothetical protein|nr:hypothetical protein [Acidobacteriaceae bacterium]
MPQRSIRRRLRHYLVAESGELTNRLTIWKKFFLFFLVAAFLISLEAFVTLASGMFKSTGFEWNPAAFAALIVFLIILWVLNRFVALQSAGALVVNPQPHSECRALILFLSTPEGFGESAIERMYLNCGDNSITAQDMLSRYQACPWRQPLSAIYSHLTRWSPGKLTFVVVVPSADHPEYERTLNNLFADHQVNPASPTATADLAARLPRDVLFRLRTQKGTVRTVGHFRETVTLLGSKLGANLEVVRGTNLHARWQDGVNFEDATSLAAILQDAFNYLETEHSVSSRDIMVDITSGNALCSAIGAAVAIDKNRRFQWVSQATGEVLPYEIEYVRPE